jgi:tetratricopeptide (TPR) repeat protein
MIESESRRSADSKFARSIKQIWKAISGLEGKPAAWVKEELLDELESRGLRPKRSQTQVSNPFDHWGKGNVPGDLRIVDFLCEVGVRRAKLSPEWLERFLQAAAYPQSLRQERLRALFGNGDVILPHQLFSLPARYGDFLGRKPDLEAVVEALRSSWPVFLVQGMGGVGKTTLALEVAYACAGQPRAAACELAWPHFTYIIWTSADGTTLTLNDLLDTIALHLGFSGLTQKSIPEKRNRVNDILAQQPVLLIVDNFETITDIAIADFCAKVPSKTQVLLTSRETEKLLPPIFQRFPPARIRLGGLPDEEALTFLRLEAQQLANLRRGNERARLEGVVAADDQTLLPLVKATEGNPKALYLALGYIADNALPLPTLVRDLYAAADSVAGLFDYFFNQAWNRCSEHARELWRVLPFFASPARREALGAAAGLEGRYFHDALEQLQSRSLVEVVGGADNEPLYHAHPLVRALPRQRSDPDLESRERKQWLAWYLEHLSRNVSDTLPHLVALDQEYDNVKVAITWALENHDPLAPTLVRNFWYYLFIRGQWRLCETFLSRALEQATSLGDTILRLHLASRLGWILQETWRPEAALKQLRQVETEILEMNQPTLLEETRVLNYLGQVYFRQNDLARAEECQIHFLRLAEQVGDRRGAHSGGYHLGQVKFRQGKIDEAEKIFRDLIKLAQDIPWLRGEGWSANRLAQVLIHQGRLDEAERWLDHSGRIANQHQEPQMQAHVCFGRAQLARQRARLQNMHDGIENAQRYALDALELYQRLEACINVDEVQAFLAELDQ